MDRDDVGASLSLLSRRISGNASTVSRDGASPTVLPTLLVVDDEPSNVELIQLLLDEVGLPVRFVTATNGLDAIRLAQGSAPALVLMDLKMPIMDGWEATRRLKADPTTAQIPIIALTAQAMVGDLDRALSAGCDGYLPKPLDIPALVALLREHLS